MTHVASYDTLMTSTSTYNGTTNAIDNDWGVVNNDRVTCCCWSLPVGKVLVACATTALVAAGAVTTGCTAAALLS